MCGSICGATHCTTDHNFYAQLLTAAMLTRDDRFDWKRGATHCTSQKQGPCKRPSADGRSVLWKGRAWM
eukprot:2511667-Amphidinium_carterae.2